MKSWAEREIELAIRDEYENAKQSGDSEYDIACYKSALKAYKSLAGDNHSGLSIMVTKAILNRLINHKPLTPITDDCEYWARKNSLDGDDYICYQNDRMPSLFKYVFEDGSVKFTDLDRVMVHPICNPEVAYGTRTALNIIDEMFPIEMPYWPGDEFKMYCEEFLCNPANGDFDTVGYLCASHANKRIEINRFFKEDENTPKLVEITKDEYEERKAISKNRKETK